MKNSDSFYDAYNKANAWLQEKLDEEFVVYFDANGVVLGEHKIKNVVVDKI